MPDGAAPHLQPAQILAAATGQLSDPGAVAHLESCAACGEEVTEMRPDSFGLGRVDEKTGRECPTAESLANFAAGPKMPDSALAAHLSGCARCNQILLLSLQPDEAQDAGPPLALRTSTRAWQKEMAAKFAAESRPNHYWRFAAMAAALILSVAIGGYWWNRQRSPERLLARAYTAARPFEYRLPDDGYSPVRQQKGAASSFDRPVAMAEAEARIRGMMESRPQDPVVLAVKGRFQLLDRDLEGAINTLSRALETRPGDVAVLTDLGTAYAARGDAEKRNVDYAHATELFLTALKTVPADQRTLFNLAIVYQKLSMLEDAAETWKKFLLQASPEWRREANEHLREVEKARAEKEKADGNILRDPVRFLAARASGQSFDPLDYFDIFWTKWIPAAFTDSAPHEAVLLLARSFDRDYHESSLLEAAVSVSPPAARIEARRSALELLARAILANRAGFAARGLKLAATASTALDATGLKGAALLARVEASYALTRAARSREAIRLTDEILRRAGTAYPWLSGYAHLQHAASRLLLGDPGAARDEIVDTEATLSRARLWPVALRAKGFITQADASTGNVGAVWESAPRNLASYWVTSANAVRAQNAQYDMAQAASLQGWNQAAAVMMATSLRYARLAGNIEIETYGRFRFAGMLARMGDKTGQLRELQKALGLLSQFDAGGGEYDESVVSTLRWQAGLLTVQARIDAGAPASAKQELAVLVASAKDRPEKDQVQLAQAEGLALLASGDPNGAQEPLRNAIRLNRRQVDSVGAWVARIPVLESVAPSVRSLTQIQLREQHDPAAALAVWQSFRPHSRTEGADLLIHLAILPAGIGIWSTRNGTTGFRWLEVSGDQVKSSAERFLHLTASPASNVSEIKKAGNQLFHWLIAPELRGMSRGIVALVSEGWVSSLPFGAFSDDFGSWLANNYSFVGSWGPATPVQSGAPDFSRALVVSAPIGVPPGRQPLPRLAAAEREADEVASHFPASTVLHDADPEQIASRSVGTVLFHFSGHGWANGGDGSLILAPGPDGSSPLLTARLLAGQNWSKCQLAVLSACLTATGEERGAVNNQSLVQAMLSAGAARVIAARWSVDSESTRALMSSFYRRLLAGAPVPEALSRAAAEVAAIRNWSHPYYWAGFDLFGAV
jgi:CHAT domain-containing protein/cytochrome c-type biogenesis protein CcmH/NrfG